MADEPTSGTHSFGSTAQGLAKNPLGIIALFLVLVYGIASFVIVGSKLELVERLPLIYFLVVFPILVLIVFTWLVIKHSGKLFAPSDFKDEANYIRMQMSAAVSLAAASAKSDGSPSEAKFASIVKIVERSAQRRRDVDSSKKCLLWVDDRPDNNIYERKAFVSIGLEIVLAETTNEALSYIKQRDFSAIISDMGRREGSREGYVLLDALREFDAETPFFIYASSNSSEHKAETARHNGQGCTNDPQELFQMVTKAVIQA